MRIFVAHDFTRPPLRGYREPFKIVEVNNTIDFIFADEVHGANNLLGQIETMIVEADACLFDVSTPNRNVFLELGFARGKSKKYSLLFRPASKWLVKLGFTDGLLDVPSDLRGDRILYYSNKLSLRFQLDELVKGLISAADLSPQQEMLGARVEDLLARHKYGLPKREIADKLNLEPSVVGGMLNVLIRQQRVKTVGSRFQTRYVKAVGPVEAAE